MMGEGFPEDLIKSTDISKQSGNTTGEHLRTEVGTEYAACTLDLLLYLAQWN